MSKKTRIIFLIALALLILATATAYTAYHDIAGSAVEPQVAVEPTPHAIATEEPPLPLVGHYASPPEWPTYGNQPMSLGYFVGPSGRMDRNSYFNYNMNTPTNMQDIHRTIKNDYSDYVVDFLEIVNGLGFGYNAAAKLLSTEQMRNFFVDIIEASSEDLLIKFVYDYSNYEQHKSQRDTQDKFTGQVIRQFYLGDQLLCELTFDYGIDNDSKKNVTLAILENSFEVSPRKMKFYFDRRLDPNGQPVRYDW